MVAFHHLCNEGTQGVNSLALRQPVERGVRLHSKRLRHLPPFLNSSARHQPFLERKERVILDGQDRKSTRLNSSHVRISYAVFCLKKKKKQTKPHTHIQ